MSGPRSRHSDDLLLIAATTILILTAQRYFQAKRFRPNPDFGNAAATPSEHSRRELAQHDRGRHSANPLRIPLAGWNDILWRTYVRTGEDRLLATAAGVVFFGLLAIFPAVTALVSCYGLFAVPICRRWP